MVGRADCRAGAKDRPASVGDRFFEGVLAAHRGTADAAGIDWKSAAYRKVKEEMKAGRGLAVERMMELGRVSPLLKRQEVGIQATAVVLRLRVNTVGRTEWASSSSWLRIIRWPSILRRVSFRKTEPMRLQYKPDSIRHGVNAR